MNTSAPSKVAAAPWGQPTAAASSPRKGGEKEKTIPFLRQLMDMLQNNEELISFVPGQRLPNNEVVHGKIIVHDRGRVQNEVLPIYFNHASFASLRRQLSYFSFVRVGRSRQMGVTYTNESVIQLSDIRKLKRRVVGKVAPQAVPTVATTNKNNNSNSSSNRRQHQAKKPQLPTQKLAQEKRLQQLAATKDDELSTTSADVASAVLSGTLHAAKTNGNMEYDNSNPSAPCTRTNTSSGGTQSSISQSLGSTADSGSSSTSGNSKRSSSNKQKKASSKTEKSKSKIVKKAYNKKASFPKPSIPRKDRARSDKLLSVNNIVPFIHLPAGRRPSKQKDASLKSSGGGGGGGSSRAGSASDRRARLIQNKYMKDQSTKKADAAAAADVGVSSSGRDRATSHDGAINALLALGGSQ